MLDKVFPFLSALAQNNHRDWFESHRGDYDLARKQVLQFAADIHAELLKFDPTISVCNPIKSVFRIYRDTRFSHDKTPYKTNMGFWFSVAPKGRVGAGYYIHLQANECFIASGIYMPPPDELQAVRQEIYFNGDILQALLNENRFTKIFGTLEDHRLKTSPKGYPKEHPNIDLLRQKSWVVSKPISAKAFHSPACAKSIAADLGIATPLVHFLNQAINLAEPKAE
jgi:uncharacterized protein (TIGR02453 family)